MHKRSIRDCGVDRVCYRVNAVLLVLFLVIVTYPFLYIVSCSFSSGQALISGKVVLLPVEFTLEGYQAIMEYRDIWTGCPRPYWRCWCCGSPSACGKAISIR